MREKPFLLKEDIVDLYHKKRPKVPKEDIEDVLNCYIEYLSRKASSKINNYPAYNIPNVGTMYFDFNKLPEKEEFTAILYGNLLREIMFVEEKNFLSLVINGGKILNRRIKGMNKDELMLNQNEIAEKD